MYDKWELGINMSLSVLLPVYGEANYISEAVISTLDNIELGDELIILLDRISENTKAVVEYFASKDERIVVMNSPEPGISSALNLGITYSDADFIARMDADDVVINNRFRMQKNFLTSHPEHVLIGSNIELIDSNGRKIGLKFFPKRSNSIKRMMFFFNPVAHPSVMIRRISLLEAGLYKTCTDGYEDYYLWTELINFGKFENSRKSFLKYRVHTNQFSSNKTNAISHSHESFLGILQSQNKSLSKLNNVYKKIINRKSNLLITLLDFKLIRDYFISLINFPKSSILLLYYYVINAMIAKIYKY